MSVMTTNISYFNLLELKSRQPQKNPSSTQLITELPELK